MYEYQKIIAYMQDSSRNGLTKEKGKKYIYQAAKGAVTDSRRS